MSAIALKLQQTLASLDPADATLLERLVDDALALVQPRAGELDQSAVDANGWPEGYFEATAGAFANEPFDVAPDSPPESNIAAFEW
ncbi:MAG: hypothetical protein QE274_02320 [Verrucomicrobiaceae bacterium]|nr:hypothetical protein [Verrucomicrobiaceae bacterium]